MAFCVHCGARLADSHRCHQCGAYKVGDVWHEGGGLAEVGTPGNTGGWRPDPTGRHEGRYYAGGQPTDLVRDGGVESIDDLGKRQLVGAGIAEFSDVERAGINSPGRMKRIALALLTVVVLATAGTVVALYLTRERESTDDKYLSAIRAAGFTGEFNSDANAVAHAKQTCRKLEDGGAQQGMPVDEVAVAHYCAQFSDGFHVLETITVTGSLTIVDDSPSYTSPAIDVSGATCTGAGGYSDIRPGNQLAVKNGQGDVLTTTLLESGAGGRYRCSFSFSFEVTEGEDRYIVSMDRRGEFSYSFGDLKSSGVGLTLGG